MWITTSRFLLLLLAGAISASPVVLAAEQPALAFYYKPLADESLLSAPADDACRLADKPATVAYSPVLQSQSRYECIWQRSDYESAFETWHHPAGPAPLVFRPKLLVRNMSEKPQAYTRHWKVTAVMGRWQTPRPTQLTDYVTLSASASPVVIKNETVTLAAVPPHTYALAALPLIRLGDLLTSHPNQWPTSLNVTVSGGAEGTQTATLRLIAPPLRPFSLWSVEPQL